MPRRARRRSGLVCARPDAVCGKSRLHRARMEAGGAVLGDQERHQDDRHARLEHRLGDDDLWALVAYLATAGASRRCSIARPPPPSALRRFASGGRVCAAAPDPSAASSRSTSTRARGATSFRASPARMSRSGRRSRTSRAAASRGNDPEHRDNMVRWLQAPHSIYSRRRDAESRRDRA